MHGGVPKQRLPFEMGKSWVGTQVPLQVSFPAVCFHRQELKQFQNADDAEVERLRGLFKTTAATVWQIFGPLACR